MLNKELAEWLRKKCSEKWENWSLRDTVHGLLPITEWLPKYKPKKDLPGDIAAGLTLGIMNIPQGNGTSFYSYKKAQWEDKFEGCIFE
jgi:hypothetical protein